MTFMTARPGGQVQKREGLGESPAVARVNQGV